MKVRMRMVVINDNNNYPAVLTKVVAMESRKFGNDQECLESK